MEITSVIWQFENFKIIFLSKNLVSEFRPPPLTYLRLNSKSTFIFNKSCTIVSFCYFGSLNTFLKRKFATVLCCQITCFLIVVISPIYTFFWQQMIKKIGRWWFWNNSYPSWFFCQNFLFFFVFNRFFVFRKI